MSWVEGHGELKIESVDLLVVGAGRELARDGLLARISGGGGGAVSSGTSEREEKRIRPAWLYPG